MAHLAKPLQQRVSLIKTGNESVLSFYIKFSSKLQYLPSLAYLFLF